MDHTETAADEVKKHLLATKPHQRLIQPSPGKRTPVDGLDAYKVAARYLKLNGK